MGVHYLRISCPHMPLHTDQLLALAIAIAFAAGLNLSAVLLTLGLLSQAGVLVLPGPIAMIGEWWVIAASATLFLVESFADKIPAFALVWNALLTFIRVPAAALLAFAATDSLSYQLQLVAAAGGGTAAFAAHSAKLALRGSVAASPEPFSNVLLSMVDDVLAVALTWFAVEYPYLAAAMALVLLILAFLLVRWILMAVRAVFRGVSRQLSRENGVSPPR